MNTFFRNTSLLIFFLSLLFPFVFAQNLSNTTNLDLTFSWSQEPQGYTFPVEVLVPSGTPPQGGFPVCVLLHGNGGNGPGTLAQFNNVFDCHILIAPSGYQNSWNICDENSDAPDVDLISDLVTNLQTYQNVNSERIRLLGFSNGAALANRMYIENNDPGIDIVCAFVSQLNVPQYHSNNFYKPSGDTDQGVSFCGYDSICNPLTTRKYLSINNENDNVIPYTGGSSMVGVDFLHAETASYNIAVHHGYSGNILTNGTAIGNPTIIEFSYLNGEVVHIKGDAMHGTNNTQLNYVKDYFGDCDPTAELNEGNSIIIQTYPNPVKKSLSIRLGQTFLGSSYSLLDITGNKCFEGNIESTSFSIDFQKLPSGIYLLRIEDQIKRLIHI